MTSLQDRGRFGHGREGLSRSGAMDQLALAAANALTGNGPGEAAVELMLAGGSFKVLEGRARIALAGASMPVTIGREPLAPSTSCTVEEGDTVTIGPASSGIFGYLAVEGGFAVAPDLGSVSLQARAGVGGFGGRPFKTGDRIPLRAGEPGGRPDRSLRPVDLPGDVPIRVVLGPQDDHFPPEAVAAFLATTYTISPDADRMGYRLSGPPIEHLHGFNIVSDGLVAGSVQVPGSGVPIVMMADYQTTGGYPKIATVITADLRALAQRRTGERVQFMAVDVTTAQGMARARAAEIAALPSLLRTVRGGLPSVEDLLGLNLAGAATDALAAEG